MAKEKIDAKTQNHGESVSPEVEIVSTDSISSSDIAKRTGGNLCVGILFDLISYRGALTMYAGSVKGPEYEKLELPPYLPYFKVYNGGSKELKDHAVILEKNSVTFVSPRPVGFNLVNGIRFSKGIFKEFSIETKEATKNQLKAKTLALEWQKVIQQPTIRA